MRTFALRIRATLVAAVVTLAAAVAIAQQAPPAGQPAPAAGQPPAAPGGRQGGGRQGPAPGSFQRMPTLPFPDSPREFEMSGTKYRVVPVVGGLANPWSLTFLPNGDMLVTEKAGRLRVVRKGVLAPEAITGIPEVWATGQGGLLEVLPHPKFTENQQLYLTYSKPCPQGGATTALLRGRFDGKALLEARDLFVADNCNTGNPHFGSKLAFGRDGMLYMSIGERGDRDRAQNLGIHGGKILRLTEDGAAAPGNPFAGRPGAKPEIFSYGHRNAQGLAFNPATGELWANEHGPQGGDELNIVKPGLNYGWPVATYGREYPPAGTIISPHPWKDGIEDAVIVWVPSIGISGMIFYTGDAFPQWKGNIFTGALSGMSVQRVGFNEKGGLLGRESLLTDLRVRIRDVRQGPDGNIYVAVDANPGGILRIEPVRGASGSGE